MLEPLGLKIRLYRNIAGISQGKLAEMLDISQQHLGCIERGETALSMTLMLKICETLDIHPSVLFSAVSIKRPYSCSSELHNEPDMPHTHPVPRHGIWLLDIVKGREIWTKSLTRMMGLKPSQKSCYNSFVRHIHDSDKKLFTDFYQTLRSTGIPEPIIFRTVTDHDFCRHIHVRADLHPGFENNSVMGLMTFMDLTESKELYAVLRHSSDQVEKIVQERTRELDQAVKEKQREIDLRDKAEKNARKNSEQLQMILSSVPAVLYSFCPSKGGMAWHSLRMKDIIGISLEDLKNNPMLWHESIHPDDLPVVKKAIAGTQQGLAFDIQYRLKDSSGKWRWLHDKGRPSSIADEDALISGVAMDITSQKYLEEKIRASEQKYRALMEQSLDMIYLHDLKGRIVNVNQAAVKGTGYSREELLNMTVFQLHPRQGDKKHIVEQWQDWQPGESAILQVEHVRRDGKAFPVEVHTGKVKIGKSEQILAVVRDISMRQKIMNELEISRTRYRHISRLISDYVYSFRVNLDNTLECTWVAGGFEEVTGYSLVGEQSTTSWEKLIHPQDLPAGVERVKRLFAGQEDVRELRIVRKDGALRWIKDHASPVWDADQNRVVGIVGAAKDITERKQFEQELAKLNSMLSEMSNVARIGGWGKNMLTGEDEWSEVTREIHEVGPDFIPNMHNSLEFYKQGRSREKISEKVTRCIETGEPYDVEVELITAKGNELWVRTLGKAEFKDGRCVRLYGTIQDITQRKQAEQKVLFLSDRDELTGLWNRKKLTSIVCDELARARRYNHPLSLIMADIDRLKKINTEHGYDAGDQVLQHFAQILQNSLREVDMAGRFSSKEFLIILSETNIEGAFALAERLRQMIENQPAFCEGANISYTISLGVTCYSQQVENEDQLFSQAGQALSKAKLKGKNSTVVWK